MRCQCYTTYVNLFNLSNSITWIAEPDGTYTASDVSGNIAESVVDMLSLTNLSQFNSKRNSNDRTFDLVLSNLDPDKIFLATEDDHDVRAVGHHPPVAPLLNVSPLRYLEENRPPKINFFKANYDVLNERISEVDWDSEFDGRDADDSVQRFYDVLSSLLKSVPTVGNAMKSYPCWYTRDLVKLLKLKIRARVKFLRSKNPMDHALFTDLRKEFKVRKRLCEAA